MPKTLTLDAALQKIDKKPLRKLASTKLGEGKSVDETIADVVAAIDAAIPWALILPGPLGIAMEAVDGPIALAIAKPLVHAVVDARAKALAKKKAKA